jgi:hypothetical protein
MAKPDLQAVYVKPDDGNLRRLDGKLGLALALENLPVHADSATAKATGLEVGTLFRTTLGALLVVV